MDSRTGLPWSEAETGVRGHVGPRGTTGLRPLRAGIVVAVSRGSCRGRRRGCSGRGEAAGVGGGLVPEELGSPPAGGVQRREKGWSGDRCVCVLVGEGGGWKVKRLVGDPPPGSTGAQLCPPPAVPRCRLPTKWMAVNAMAPWGARVPPQAVGVLRSDCTGVPGACGLCSARCGVRGLRLKGPASDQGQASR